MSIAGRMRARLRNLASLAKRAKPAVGQTPADVVHRENKWRLLHYRPVHATATERPPILMVPSLINRHYILDLAPGRSFVEYLVQSGRDVYMIDWGTPGPEDRYLTWDDICDRYIGRAVRKVARRSPTGSVHLFGYCLGGTMTAIYTAARPERIASLVALATPIDFHDGGLLSRWANTRTFDIDALIEAFGNVPWPLMQASFHLLRPTTNLAKVVRLVDKLWDDTFLDGFFATERWGNDNVSFPGECYRRYITELYQGNALMHDRFTLSGAPAKMSNIQCPLLAVTFEHDHIVPQSSAAPLVDMVSSERAERLDMPGGHVGAVVSRRAKDGLWPALLAWWASCDEGPYRPADTPGSRPFGPSTNETKSSHSSRSNSLSDS